VKQGTPPKLQLA